MPRDMKNGPGVITPEPATSSVPTSTINTSIVEHRGIAVTTIDYAPAGRRTCWLSVVETCPHCRGSHVHRGDTEQPASDHRTAGCGRGAYYVTPQTKGRVTS